MWNAPPAPRSGTSGEAPNRIPAQMGGPGPVRRPRRRYRGRAPPRVLHTPSLSTDRLTGRPCGLPSTRPVENPRAGDDSCENGRDRATAAPFDADQPGDRWLPPALFHAERPSARRTAGGQQPGPQTGERRQPQRTRRPRRGGRRRSAGRETVVEMLGAPAHPDGDVAGRRRPRPGFSHRHADVQSGTGPTEWAPAGDTKRNNSHRGAVAVGASTLMRSSTPVAPERRLGLGRLDVGEAPDHRVTLFGIVNFGARAPQGRRPAPLRWPGCWLASRACWSRWRRPTAWRASLGR